MLLKLFGFLIFLILPVSTSLKADQRGVPGNLWQLKPQALPTTLTNVSTLANNIPPIGRDVYVCHLDLSIAPNSGTVDITIQSAGSTVTYFWRAVPMTSTSMTEGAAYNNVINGTLPENCPYFPGGVAILGSASGVTISSMSGRY